MQQQEAAGPGHYDQQLSRALRVLGNIAITVSAVTPAASVFIIAPVALNQLGSAAFLSFVLAAVIGVGMAFSYAELGAAYPVAGGDYAIVSRVLGRGIGFLSFVLWLVLGIFIPSAIALGAGQYLGVVWEGANPNLVGLLIMLAAAVIAILNIRFNAWVTGVFLVIELLAVGVVAVLGFANVQQPVSELFSPHLFAAGGEATAAGTGLILTGVAIAIFSYNGYGGAIYFSEEMEGARKGIAKAVLWALLITVAAELIPVTAALLGTPSLAALTNAETPMSYLTTTLGSDTLNTFVSLGIAVAIFNATIAILLEFGRVVFSSARDRAWPGPVNQVLAAVHPRLRTPWGATALVGVVGGLLTFLSDIAVLVTFTGVVLTLNYALIALSALVSRARKGGPERPYRMPLWPLWPLLALAGTVLVFTKQTGPDILTALAIVAVGAVYYLAYLRPRRATHWVMLQPPRAAEAEAPSPGAPAVGSLAREEPEVP